MPGKKGTWLVDDNWFAYYQHGQNYARYRQYRAAQNTCPARLILQPCGRYKMTTAHNGHPNEETDIHRNAVHDACKEAARRELSAPQQIFNRIRAQHPDAEIGFNGNIQRTIQRAKEKALPCIPQIVEEADRFIREHDRFRPIAEAKLFFFYATFLVVPIGFYQLFTVHIALNNHVFPVVYVLMTTKRQALYQVVFDRLMKIIAEEVQGNGFLVESLISDFETAILNVMQASFPNSRMMGCWFHFGQFNHDNIMSQAIYRYACSDELHL
ncbi:Uncharacterized protein APZ42_001168 [Daphnia magna]|uniref:MULE transposase domain-containing protein n=1 Tax=Daphnia magna TaxID=35525 RepID=A0A164J4U4_9CRUS|nr:Uncharacterized protein APZ42_001168 [Daphnia magna]